MYQNDSARLAPTAALVMAWAEALYRDGPAAAFYRSLDLSGGTELLNACNRFCPWYGEVILNRKYLITELAVAAARYSPEPCTVHIPAAGMSPLSLVLLDRCGDAIVRIQETDISHMDSKERLYQRVAPEAARKIACVTADITDPGFFLRSDDDTPVVAVLEGISYYLPQPVLRRLLAGLPKGAGGSQIIIEYLLPEGDIAPTRRRFPKEVFGIICTSWGCPALSRYSPAEITDIIRSCGGEITGQYSLWEMELARTGRNRHFLNDADGWIGITEARF